MSPRVLLGVFVGGKSSRMGADKAALHTPGSEETLLARLLRVGREAGLEPVVVGESDASLAPDATWLRDDPPNVGPLGGLSALLSRAAQQKSAAIAVACDMPFVSATLLRKLASAPSSAPVLAARDVETGKWQPLCARYDAVAVPPVLRALLAEGKRSFQALLDRAGCEELVLTDEERAQLRDWDTPQDMARDRDDAKT